MTVSRTPARNRAGIGRFVDDARRDRYFAACDAVHALGAPAHAETDVETCFGTTHVYAYGPEDPAARSRVPVVLLHGAGTCSAMWYPNTPALSAARPVYAVDTPGDPGRSVQRAPVDRPEDAARWLDETLAGLGLDRVHLVGASYGGWLALNQAHRRPGRLASVTLLDPGGLEKVGLRFFAWIFASLFATFAPRALRPRLAAWLEQPVLVVPELRTMVREGIRAYRVCRPAPLPLSDDELSTIRTPLYLVLGKRSLLVNPRRQAERVPRLIAGARAEIVSGTGHGPQIDQADEVNRRMLDFMASVD
ncbi:alpha/beta fold hydrolase [Streptomyces somaliensis DSM 40738]|uniref:Alpha/beta fold hydrolase n=1 Tax=Streptomyces somaliensis (strain ATCC 33201 / DSM 40738 / JCM 12659 / KCTC 9044 / NCTC 11332 / NRRL B-12077 / IP 733) TaxID=1134445 RepID=A0AA44DAN1_STRE0|nr:alpha/beta fold hydrolase [Streptomyces somaliensis]MCQ0022812.1 alpha/beta fold hydrolase [Streptomyces somaliensis DSM 40738]NKY12974.1 alpha/beta fold hydrolase [Streptomyces somaliensis DSM 40738]